MFPYKINISFSNVPYQTPYNTYCNVIIQYHNNYSHMTYMLYITLSTYVVHENAITDIHMRMLCEGIRI